MWQTNISDSICKFKENENTLKINDKELQPNIHLSSMSTEWKWICVDSYMEMALGFWFWFVLFFSRGLPSTKIQWREMSRLSFKNINSEYTNIPVKRNYEWTSVRYGCTQWPIWSRISLYIFEPERFRRQENQLSKARL